LAHHDLACLLCEYNAVRKYLDGKGVKLYAAYGQVEALFDTKINRKGEIGPGDNELMKLRTEINAKGGVAPWALTQFINKQGRDKVCDAGALQALRASGFLNESNVTAMGAQLTFRLLWSRILLADLPTRSPSDRFSWNMSSKRDMRASGISLPRKNPHTGRGCWHLIATAHTTYSQERTKRQAGWQEVEEAEEVVEEAEEAKQEVEEGEDSRFLSSFESETDSGVPLAPNGGLPSNIFGSILSSTQPRSLFGREIIPTSPSTSKMSLGEFVDLIGILFDNGWTEGSTSPRGSHSDLGSLRHLTLDDRKALHAHLYEKVAATESLLLVQALRKEVTDWSADGREYRGWGATDLIDMAKQNFTWWARMYLSDLRSNTSLKSNKKSQLIMGAPRPGNDMANTHKHQQQQLSEVHNEMVLLTAGDACAAISGWPEGGLETRVSQVVQVDSKPDEFFMHPYTNHAASHILHLEASTSLRDRFPSEYMDPDFSEGTELVATEGTGSVSIIYKGMHHVACSPHMLIDVWEFVVTKRAYAGLFDMAKRIVDHGPQRKGDFVTKREDGDGSDDIEFATFIRAHTRLGYTHKGHYVCGGCSTGVLEQMRDLYGDKDPGEGTSKGAAKRARKFHHGVEGHPSGRRRSKEWKAQQVHHTEWKAAQKLLPRAPVPPKRAPAPQKRAPGEGTSRSAAKRRKKKEGKARN
jgi:hypothetical protein